MKRRERLTAATPRGQALVLFALTLLLMALMVLITLGVGMRVRENHETQTLADAAAYSTAVATARMYNNISITNRLQISYWVAQAADQSLISWTSVARAYVIGASQAASAVNSATGGCSAASNAASFLRNQHDSVLVKGGLWDSRDQAAAAESAGIRTYISDITVQTRNHYHNVFVPQVLDINHPNSPTAAIRALSGLSTNEFSFVPNSIAYREADCGMHDPAGIGDTAPGTGVCSLMGWSQNTLQAAAGTRGDAFVTGRGVMPPLVTQIFNNAMSNYNVTIGGSAPSGSGYWGPGQHSYNTGVRYSWADDHGTVNVRACGVTRSRAVTARVRSTNIEDTTDDHVWSPLGNPADAEPPHTRHTYGVCVGVCPAIWVRSLVFYPGPGGGSPDDAHGQPKNYAVALRDFSQRPFADPWTWPRFRLDFDRDGQTWEFDNRAEYIQSGGWGTVNISQQAALASAVTYYHRKMPNAALRWREFPNFLNPFWRATLVPADIDRPGHLPAGGTDIPDTLGLIPNPGLAPPPVPWHRETFLQLMAQGYRGVH